MISQQTGSAPLQILSSTWNELGAPWKTLLLYVMSITVYISLYFFPLNAFAPLRALSGTILLIALPGAQISRLILPEDSRNLWTSLTLGLLVAVLETQAAFMLSLFIGLQVPLFYWLLLPSMAILWGALLHDYKTGQCGRLWLALQLGVDKKLLWILAAAFVVRIAFYFVAIDTIAPDAALYADFARWIMDGSFQSSIVNERGIVELWNGVYLIPHQAFVYLFAISWLLLPPGASGPTFILLLAGLMLVPASFWVTKRFFNSNAGYWVSLIVSIHPLFVFHSVVAYGPEITSLMFALFGLLLVLEGRKGNRMALFAGGLMIGLVDAIWYPNLFVLCVVISVFLLFSPNCSITKSLSLSILLVLVVLARLFHTSALIFFTCWATLFFLLAFFRRRVKNIELHHLGPSFLGVMLMMWFWFWPVQSWEPIYGTYNTLVSANLTLLAMVDYQAILSLLSLSIEPMTVVRFLFFLVFHLSTALLVLLVVSVVRAKKLDHTRSLFAAAGASAIGTLLVVGSFNKEVLLPVYIYSDSRFFLSVIFVMILSLGGVFSRIDFVTKQGPTKSIQLPLLFRKKRGAIIVLGLIIVGLLPNYLAMPAGIDLVQIEDRYGWSGLANQVDDLGDVGSLFLVDRAREFSWLTGRRSAHLYLSTSDDTTPKALARITSIRNSLSVDYLVIDAYTLARWGTMYSLLSTSLSVGRAILLDMSILTYLESLNFTGPVGALCLDVETDPNLHGNYSRVFEFTEASFSLAWKLELLDGWYAENNGEIVNSTGQLELVIGNQRNSTQLHRATPLDLDVGVSGGFFLCNLTNNGANLEEIEVVDVYGTPIGFAEPLGDGFYFLIVGDTAVGDIRITCSGEAGQSITIEYLALWQQVQ